MSRVLLLACALPLAAALNNGLASKPGLGWNSDYCTKCVASASSKNLGGFQNEAFIRHISDFINASGLQALGYRYVNMDSLWNLPTRDANGDLMPDPARWPSGFDKIVAYVHGNGQGFGVYGDRGTLDCNKNPGQLGHETQDAAFFARNGIDFFKSDSCYASPDHATAFKEYGTMRDALNATGREIWFALCGWNTYYAWEAPGAALGNSYRIGVDTGGGWGPVMSNVAGMLRGGPNGSSLAAYGRPGAWNDMSLLLNPGMGSGANLMSNERHRSQFGLHCIFNANALMTGNLSALDPYVLATWGNAEAVAINQDTAHTFIQLPLDAPPLQAQGLAPARVAECGGEPQAQNWTFDRPALGFLTNAANAVCLNVDDCASALIYDGCTTSGTTCAGVGKFNNEEFTLDARGALVSALPGARCVTAAADGSLALAACAAPLAAAQTWRHDATTGALIVADSGRCLTVDAPPPPALESLLVGRELADDSWAIFALNNGAAPATLACGAGCLAALGFAASDVLKVRDVWAHADLAPVTAGALALPAPAAGGSAFWRVTKQ